MLLIQYEVIIISSSLVGDLCELFCTSEDGKYQISPPIDDGTPCKGEGGLEGRCLGKLCAVSNCIMFTNKATKGFS